MCTLAMMRRTPSAASVKARTAAPVAVRSPVQCRSVRKQNYADPEQQDVGRVVEEASAASHGLFDDNFKAVLADALSRQGTNSLLQSQEKVSDENQISGQEEVLLAAIMASRSTLMKLQMVKEQVDKAIEVETKQVERLQFALQKARSDAAYYRGLENMRSEVDYSGND